ncbi:unnamed protein product, partial [Rotaria magnacalcarata]
MSFFPINISLVEGQCLGGKLPDTVNVAIQIDGTQVLYRDIDDDIQMSEFALQESIPLGLADLATSRIYSSETSVIQTLQYHHPIIHVQLNQLINYFDPRSEYIRAIVIEWSTKSSITIARIISADIQCCLLSARRCKNFDDYTHVIKIASLLAINREIEENRQLIAISQKKNRRFITINR